MAVRIFIVTCLLVGCTPPSPLLEEKLGGDSPTKVLAPCDPPLSLSPSEAFVNPSGLTLLQAQGGTGAYAFALEDPTHGGFVHPHSGAYMARPDAEGDGTIVLTDAGCIGSASAVVHVVPPMAVQPFDALLPLGAQFDFVVTGGSGEVQAAMLTSQSGGVITSDGSYIGGATPGRDLVELRDLRTGERVVANIVLAPTVVLEVSPARVLLPVGSQITLAFSGGSGVFSTDDTSALVSFEPVTQRLVGLSPGTSTLVFDDVFADLQVSVAVSVVDTLRATFIPASTQTNGGMFARARLADGRLGPVDADADGVPDLIFGFEEPNITAMSSGAVFIWRGGPSFGAAPQRTLAGGGMQEYFGRSLGAGDLDGDGLIDLVVGAPNAANGGVRPGSVSIYGGVAGQLFTAAPVSVLVGEFGGDELGSDLVICDFDGDGRLDLAVGIPGAEDREVTPLTSRQGGVAIYLGHHGGFAAKPEQKIFGRPAHDGEWLPDASLALGTRLAAGDLDGDGRCELAASAPGYNSTWQHPNPAARSRDGAVFVYGGRPGGITADPIFWIAGADPNEGNTELGTALAIGDLNHDGLADLVVAEPFADGAGSNTGRIDVFAGGRSYDDAFTPLLWGDADYHLVGAVTGGQLGRSLDIADVDGDDLDDLVLGAPGERVEPLGNGAGVVWMVPGREGGWPDAPPMRLLDGVAAGENLGMVVTAVGDFDDDGHGDIAALASRSSVAGKQIGEVRIVSETNVHALEMTYPAAGAQFGASIALGDFNDDGIFDVAVGASRDDSSSGFDAGAVFVYHGSGAGWGSMPSLHLLPPPSQTGDNFFGFALAAGGDFDGDGVTDLAVVSNRANVPATFNDAFVDPGCSPGASKVNVGAVFVYRGTPAGLEEPPAFVMFSPRLAGSVHSVAFADVDGDGVSDLVAGSPTWTNEGGDGAGGLVVWLGNRAPAAGKITVVCDPALVAYGAEAGGRLGESIAPLGDLDGDGCEELAVSASAENLSGVEALARQGTVRIVYGWGAACDRSSPAMLLLRSAMNGASANRLASADLDGDGLRELIVGAPEAGSTSLQLGFVVVIDGVRLAEGATDAVTMPTINGDVPVQPSETYLRSVDPRRMLLAGPGMDQAFGASVAGVRTSEGLVMVGVPFGAVSGEAFTGGVIGYRYSAADGLDPTPALAVPGDTGVPNPQFGVQVVVGGAPPVLCVGSLRSHRVSIDTGAAFCAPLP